VNYHWEEVERELFKSVFRLAPDTSPCDLSIICRKPCFEVFGLNTPLNPPLTKPTRRQMYIERSKLLSTMDPDDILIDPTAQDQDNSRIDILFREYKILGFFG